MSRFARFASISALAAALLTAQVSFAQQPYTNSTGAVQGQVGFTDGTTTPAQGYPVTPYPTASEPAGLPPVFQPAMPSTNPQAMPQTAQPYAPAQPQPPAVPAATPAAPAAQQLPADPCAAYMASYEVYAVCQDRMKKLQRMKDAKTKRLEDAKAEREARIKARNPQPAVPANSGGLKGPSRPGEVMPPEKIIPVQVVPPTATTGTPAAPEPTTIITPNTPGVQYQTNQ